MILKPQSYDPFRMRRTTGLSEIFEAVAEDIRSESVALNAIDVARGNAVEPIEETQKETADYVGCFSIVISGNLRARLGGHDKMEAGIEDSVVREALIAEGQSGSDHYDLQLNRGADLSLDDQFQNAVISRDGALYKSFCNQLAKRLPAPSV